MDTSKAANGAEPEQSIYTLKRSGEQTFLFHGNHLAAGRVLLTSDSATDRMPRWSPDGKWIACFSNRSGRLELWKIRPDGSDLQQLTEGGAGYNCMVCGRLTHRDGRRGRRGDRQEERLDLRPESPVGTANSRGSATARPSVDPLPGEFVVAQW
jgi:WD40 repeat protein